MPDETTVAALGEALNEHLTERASEAGCRLACGYDGDDMAAHLARALLASPALADLLRAERVRALREAADAPWEPSHAAGHQWLRDRAEREATR